MQEQAGAQTLMTTETNFKSQLRRWYYRMLWLGFGALMPFVKKFRDQPCYWRTMFLYHSLSTDKQARCVINVILNVHLRGEPRGHMWLTLDGKNYHKFRQGRHEELAAKMELVATEGVYRYWVAVPGKEIGEVKLNSP
jgi:hypothetical protein